MLRSSKKWLLLLLVLELSRANTSYFVEMNRQQRIRRVIGGTVIVPCRTTSPDYKVEIILSDGSTPEDGSSVEWEDSYDPRFGFKLRNIEASDSGVLFCILGEGVDNRTVELIVKRQLPVVSGLTIIKDTLKHVTRGQTVHVNCTTVIDTDVGQFDFNWTTPLQGSRITTRHYTEYVRYYSRKMTCELTINEFTDKDEGVYWCHIDASPIYRAKKINITFREPEVIYINLTSPDNDRYYQRMLGDYIQWIVFVDANPQPELKWVDPEGDKILQSRTDPKRSKYHVQRTLSSTMLRINNLHFNDRGIYSLQACNGDRLESLNFTLKVLGKPKLALDSPKKFYSLNEKANIFCRFKAVPAPNISWTFLKAPNYPSLAGSEMLKLKNDLMGPKLSRLNMTIEMCGELTCTACNTLGCSSKSTPILIFDFPKGFGVVHQTYMLTVGDDVEIVCAAPPCKYIRVEWLNDTDGEIVETDRISITKTSTNFSHRSTLRIKNVQKSDNNKYVCSSITHNNEIVRSEYNLQLVAPEKPFIWKTNMNNLTVALDLNTELHNPMTLQCKSTGLPRPNVTWYKDEMRIRANEQYNFLNDNETLYIKYFHEEDSGKYTCKVENHFGKAENFQRISIKANYVSKVLIVSIAASVLIFAILIIYIYIKMRHGKVRQLMELGMTHFEEGALESLNPGLTVNDQVEILPYDDKWEFPRERLKFGKQLGFGAFGVVKKADAVGICKDQAVSTVAVKMVRKSTRSTYIRALANELKIMVHVGKHLNVVNLLGACTKNINKRDLLVIVEYCRFGNLHDYLCKHRADFIDQIDPTTRKLDPSIGLDILTDSRGISTSSDGYVLSNNSPQPDGRPTCTRDYKDQNPKPLCTQDLLSWAFQVARGMEYLSKRKVLHGDLAARNILLAENNVVKICDFGLAKTLYEDYNYKKKDDVPLPIKWMAIESIKSRVFSTQSDVWSFGITLWEFFTLAKAPYPNMDAEMQYQRLVEGYRMAQPEYATYEVYDIMLQCWKGRPTLRPRFTDLVSSIGDLLEESVKAYYVDLNAPYLDMNTVAHESGKHDYLMMMSAPDHDALVSQSNDYVNSPSASLAIPQDNSYIPMSPLIHGSDLDTSCPRIT